jgi:NADPH:quinone reductase-like Zn-dependent oxidoreductase
MSAARALFHTAPRRVEIRDVPVPRAAPGEVVVRTVCSGISSGTERLVFRGDVPEDVALDDTIKALAGTFRYPFPYGYACVGQVEGQDALLSELPLDEFCTHTFPFAAATDAFRAVDENAPGLMHAVLDYDGGPL